MKIKKSIAFNIPSNKLLYINNTIGKTPIIFNKKINKLNWKPVQYVSNDTGLTRHYPPGTQEWYNSIYTFNKNLIKTLPVLDTNLMKLLKSYFNMAVSHKVLKIKRARFNRFRRFSSRKTFVGRGDLKHTNSKVIITMYHFNTEKIFLLRQVQKWFKILHLAKSIFKIGKSWDRSKQKWVTSYFRPYTLNEFINSPAKSEITYVNYPLNIRKPLLTYREAYYLVVTREINRFLSVLKVTNKYYNFLSKLVEKKVLNNDEKLLIYKNAILGLNLSLKEYPKYYDYINSIVWSYKKNLIRSLYLLKSNMAKSHPLFLNNLSYMVEGMYNKDVEFNVVELNQIFLNSDIFTQAVVLKLKNRKNSLYKVLRTSLRKVNLPNVSRKEEKYYEFNKHDLLVNKIRNSYISSMFDNTTNIDPLNKLLLDLYHSSEDLNIKVKDNNTSSNTLLPVSLENYILKSLKHMKLAGVRVEAKGRLTKRFTASRSVFKLRWKGGLKNVDSSFKGLSTVMLRGIVKSNVQYTLLNSKTRNGAFGIKGWIGSK